MHSDITYRPFRSHTYFIPFMLGACMITFIAAGFYLPQIGFPLFFLLTLGLLSLFLVKYLYDTANITVIFEQDGLRIIGGKHNNHRYVNWEQFAYAYYARNFKGHFFLVLSPKDMTTELVRHYANRSAVSSSFFIDSVVVIAMDPTQDISPLKELINSKVPHISEY